MPMLTYAQCLLVVASSEGVTLTQPEQPPGHPYRLAQNQILGTKETGTVGRLLVIYKKMRTNMHKLKKKKNCV